MKTIQLYIIVCLAIICDVSVSAQQSDVLRLHESVAVTIDRSLYISGEQIFFAAEVYSENISNNPGKVPVSILYIELITPNGTQVSGGKFMISEGKSQGCLRIPNDIITGVYYFRAYTKLMRNEGPSAYEYLRLKIINPNKNEVIAGTGVSISNENKSDSVVNNNSLNFIGLYTDKLVYKVRDTVHLSLKSNVSQLKKFRNLSLTVSPEDATPYFGSILPTANRLLQNEIFYSENRGVTLTGKVIDARRNIPLADVMVNLSIIDQGRDFMANRTDSSGRFYFSLPFYTGNRDMFICTEKLPGTEAKILVDNEFCSLPVQMPSPVFELSEKEKETAYKMAVNSIVQTAFLPDTTSANDAAKVTEKPFYGTPSEILYMDQYIQLPTLEEYFNELPSVAKVRMRKGEKYFKVFGTQNELEVFDPLVLIDQVAVDDPEKILKILPQNVSRIEIVNEPYVKGSMIYGGIISIISKRGDFAGIDLPSSGIFINYRFLEDNSKCNILQPADSKHPDTRNTLFWQPNVIVDQNGTASCAFTTSDTPGRYQAVLVITDSQGREFSQSVNFLVL
jgi:hypothetical protein